MFGRLSQTLTPLAPVKKMKVFPWRSSPSEHWASWQCRVQQLYSPVSAPVEFTSCNRLCWLKCLILKESQ